MQAETYSCPSCGAAISKDSVQCQYCSALLQTVACPACFGMMFRGSKFCPHCGAKSEPAGPVAATAHHCPRCGVELQAVLVGGTRLEECTRCGGLWVDAGTFDRICSDREAQTAALGIALPAPVAIEEHVRYVKCPQCQELMNRHSYAYGSGVIIDICRPHGIWLDRDELRKIIEFIRAGGLDRARKVEKEQLEDARRQAQAQRVDPFIGQEALGSSVDLHRGPDLYDGVAAFVRWLFK